MFLELRLRHLFELSTFLEVAYQRILQLTYVEDLLAAIKALFVKLFEPFLTAFVASLHSLNKSSRGVSAPIATWDFAKALEGWDKVFDKVLKGLEDKSVQVSANLRRSGIPH